MLLAITKKLEMRLASNPTRRSFILDYFYSLSPEDKEYLCIQADWNVDQLEHEIEKTQMKELYEMDK